MIEPRRHGRAEMVFAASPSGETFLARQYAAYPFHLCRPHRYAGDPAGMATLYLQSIAGGIFEGDRLVETIVVNAGAQAHVTTQAATIVHAMERADAQLSIDLSLGEGAFLEYLPDAMILFPHARLTGRTALRLGASAGAIVGESFLHHDPTGRHRFFDWFHSEFSVLDAAGELLVLDRFRLMGTELGGDETGAMGSYRGHGWLAAIGKDCGGARPLEALRAALAEIPGIYAGSSELPNGAGCWLRILAADGAALRQAMQTGWRALRRNLTGVEPAIRRK